MITQGKQEAAICVNQSSEGKQTEYEQIDRTGL